MQADLGRLIKAIILLTSEGNRVFSRNSILTLLGSGYLSHIGRLVEDGLLAALGEYYVVKVPRVVLLTMAPGSVVDKLTEYISWREFEEFITYALDNVGFRSFTNIRIYAGRFRGEFDVISYRGSDVVVVEAKHWLSMGEDEVKAIAVKHSAKVNMLARNWDALLRKIVIMPREASLYPIVVTLRDIKTIIYEGVPVVSFTRLMDFLRNFDDVKNSLTKYQASAPVFFRHR